MTTANPYLLDEALESDGLSLDTWHMPRPDDFAENPAVHLVHLDCQRGDPFIVSWCGIALDEDAQLAIDVDGVDFDELCKWCVSTFIYGGRCPSCGFTADALEHYYD